MPLPSGSLRSNSLRGWICQSCRRRSGLLSTQRRGQASASTLPKSPARTRFAPSPTGYLHLGSLRTALFNYLLAKATGGQFLLRVEDTDQKRTVDDAEERLFEDLEWAGLSWEEGPKVGGPFGPYKQSERTALYLEHAAKLLDSGHAYRCFCTQERLNTLAMQRTKLGLPADYDRTCAHIPPEESADRASKGEAHVIRLKMPPVAPAFNDLVYGKVRSRQDQSRKAQLYPAFEDPIMLKSDGFPTYHLANVVDDHHMNITHVIRGAEWMSSTPKHLVLYDAFKWTPPVFAHVGLLTDQNRQKLSKRNMDLNISALRRNVGVLPESLTNFVALLGWSHNRKSDIMDLQELIDNFTLKFTKGDAVVTFDKLWYLQRAHVARYVAEKSGPNDSNGLKVLTGPIVKVLQETQLSISDAILKQQSVEDYLQKLLRIDARNYTNAAAFVARNRHFFETPSRTALSKKRPSLNIERRSGGTESVSMELLGEIVPLLSKIGEQDWTANNIRNVVNDQLIMHDRATNFGVKAWSRFVHGYIRWALSAGQPGPDGADTMEILGREETLARLSAAAEIITSTPEEKTA